MQRKTYGLLWALTFFSTREWNFADDNMRRLCSLLSSRDRVLFPVDVTVMDWEVYFSAAVSGTKRHLEGDAHLARVPSCL